MVLKDNQGRIHDYLRIAVTDKCNLRCRYCMPEKGIDFARREDLLSYEEIVRLSRIFTELGVRKIRITGGEPFVRKDMPELLKRLAELGPEIYLTSNATLIDGYESVLDHSSIRGINVSLDTLNRERFFAITRRDLYDRVMSNILNCLDADIELKINVVVMKGVNDDEIGDFVQFGAENGIEVRFIEAMPFNEDDGNKDVFMPIEDILCEVQKHHGFPEMVPSARPSSSIRYSLATKDYTFAVIPAYTRSLCGSCNRLRLTPKGELLNCLYSSSGISLRDLMRSDKVGDEEIIQAIRSHLKLKELNGHHEEAKRAGMVFQSMTSIGG